MVMLRVLNFVCPISHVKGWTEQHGHEHVQFIHCSKVLSPMQSITSIN